MKAIVSDGLLVALCDVPRYVRLNPDNGCYVQAEEAEAEAIAVNGELYNLPGGTAIADRPEAFVNEQDAAEYIFANQTLIVQTAETQDVLQVAMCEQDAVNDERMSALEEAVCALDSAING